MEEDQSTNQNPVKKQDFLWITGEFHFGNLPGAKTKRLPRMNTDNADFGKRQWVSVPAARPVGMMNFLKSDDGVTLSSIALNVPGAQRRKAKDAKNPGPFAAPEILQLLKRYWTVVY